MALFALVDCNNFYVSCECVFQPKLEGRPVLVLSNNDGCAVARSAEAKALGIKMGTPAFQIKDLIRREKIVLCSSNYTLYGDMSARVDAALQTFAPRVENYSIDESFLGLADLPAGADVIALGRQMRATVRRWTGIPVCVGIGTTKTLAKLANHLAKVHPGFAGVADLRRPDVQAFLAQTAVREVWGIGPAYVERLAGLGVRTVAELAGLTPTVAREALTVVGQRTVLELNGISCIPLELAPPPKKVTAVTRSFGKPVTTFPGMQEAVSFYAARAGEKLRRAGQAAGHLTVFMHTNRFNDDPRRSASGAIRLLDPTNDSRALIAAALDVARAIWRDGYRYSKAGIICNDLSATGAGQGSLFAPAGRTADPRLMAAMDSLNKRMGRGTVFPAATGIRRSWAIRAEHHSPHYTTRWADLPLARA